MILSADELDESNLPTSQNSNIQSEGQAEVPIEREPLCPPPPAGQVEVAGPDADEVEQIVAASKEPVTVRCPNCHSLVLTVVGIDNFLILLQNKLNSNAIFE